MRGAWVPLLLELRRRALLERRRGRSARFVALTFASGAMLALAAAWILGFAWILWVVGLWWLAAGFLFLIGISYFPWAAAREIAIPLGWPKAAFRLAAMSRETHQDPTGGGLIAAAWALGRQKTPSADDAAWIEARRDQTGRLGDCRVVATALIAAARDDRDGARSLLESVALLPEVTPTARELAGEWLACDDAERGQWRRMLARAPRRVHGQLSVDAGELGLPDQVDQVRKPAADRPEQLWPATALTFFLESVAARLVGAAGAPGDVALVLHWLEAPRRADTWTLLRRALAAPRAETPVVKPAEPNVPSFEPGLDPVGVAVGAHVTALDAHARRQLDRDHVIAAAAAWDRALASTDARTEVLQRALDVGAPADAGHRVLDDLARTAAEDLATLIVAAAMPVADLRAAAPGRTLDAVVARVRHRLLADFELAVSRTAERVRGRRPLPAIDEWREILALRGAHLRAVRIGGDELRRLAFPHLHEELTPWMVWLWNQRDEHAISDAITCWLLAEALAVGDAQAIETHGKNASLPLPGRPQL